MSNTDKSAEEIIEETMQEIYNDIKKNDTKKNDRKKSDIKKTDRKKTEHKKRTSEEAAQKKEAEKEAVENNKEAAETLEETEALEKEAAEEKAPEGDAASYEKAEAPEEDGGSEDAASYEEDETPQEDDGSEDDGSEDAASYEEVEIPEEDEALYEEDDEPENKKKKGGFKKKVAIVLGSMAGVVLLAYAGLAVYFGSHFIFRTSVNGTDVSMKSASQVEADMEQQVAGYTLTLEGSDGHTEQINGADIGIRYVPGEEVEKLVKEQNNLFWIEALWKAPEIEAEVGVEYEKSALEKQVNALSFLAEENQTPSADAHPEFQNTEFVVVPEVIGTQIDTEKFHSAIGEAIDEFRHSLKLEDTGCYLKPRFVQDSPEVIAARDAMNGYLGANITYDFNPNTEVVDSSVISQWITYDENMNVGFNTEAVKAYIASLAEKYNTKGKARQFTTANGNVVTVEGGKFGWLLDQEAEYGVLTANIQNGETVTREPAWASRGVSHGAIDIGSTYAEVDLTNQHMYFIQNGQVVLDSPIVTGNPNKGNATPQGTYSLTYKTRNATLRGEKRPDGTYSYETPVAYWMPFNGGIGFHDATWQASFGGSRYKSHGSHGCVNMPKDKAGQLYQLLPEKCPVVCHY